MPGVDDLLYPALCCDGSLVVWSDATDFYLHSPALVPPYEERGRTVCAGCGCDQFSTPCPGGAFSTPTADGMIWVVAGRPETTEFLGVRVLPGTEMALRGSVTQEGDDAWTSGSVGCGKATLTGTFQVTGSTALGVRYGYQWFQRMVRWPCDCTCEASTLTLWLWCDETSANAGRRHLREARVVEWEIDDSNPLLGACHGINVNVTWEIEDARLWLDPELVVDTSAAAWTINLADAAHSDGCTPFVACTGDPEGMVWVDWEEERPTRPIRLRSDGSWCPVGSYWEGELQVFGGQAVAVVDSYETVDLPNKTCADCGQYGIRLIYNEVDPLPNTYTFESVRWTNAAWQQQRMDVSCSCPVRVVETVHIYDTPASTPGNPPERHVDKAAYSGGDPGDDDDCCMISLEWINELFGLWHPEVAAPGSGRTGWAPNGGYPFAGPAYSGFPPVGCKIVISRWECSPIWSAGFGNCRGSEAGINLETNGRWVSNGWAHDPFTSEFPPPGSDLVVVNQMTTPVRVGSWQAKDTLGCLPGGPDAAQGPPLTDPAVDLSDLVEWCNPQAQAVWAHPILAGACERTLTTLVTIAAGAGGTLRWLRWVIWPRVADYGDLNTPASRAQYQTVDPVAIGEVPILAAGQTVTFDGQRGAVLLDCDGGQVESELAGFGPAGLHQHTELAPGQDYLFAVLPHPWATPDSAWYRAETVEWELP